jgi:hypothetical protein
MVALNHTSIRREGRSTLHADYTFRYSLVVVGRIGSGSDDSRLWNVGYNNRRSNYRQHNDPGGDGDHASSLYLLQRGWGNHHQSGSEHNGHSVRQYDHTREHNGNEHGNYNPESQHHNSFGYNHYTANHFSQFDCYAEHHSRSGNSSSKHGNSWSEYHHAGDNRQCKPKCGRFRRKQCQCTGNNSSSAEHPDDSGRDWITGPGDCDTCSGNNHGATTEQYDSATAVVTWM